MATDNDELWNEATRKGEMLLKMMQGEQEVTASTFTGFPDEFEKWGYVRQQKLADDQSEMGFFGLDTVMRDLGLWDKNRRTPEDDGYFECWEVQHNQDVIADGEFYQSTGARFFFGFEASSGVLVSTSLRSPENMAPEFPRYPPLKHVSDMLWGQWSCLKDRPRVDNIRIYIVTQVLNDKALDIIWRVIRSAGLGCWQMWPGTRLGMETEEGRALLGTPVGQGIRYLLAQHKAQLGSKTVTMVDLYEAEMGGFPNLVFHIEDLEKEKVTH
ncbi:hypothetical protein N0V90_001296 [Kalmusia sp. IMI 367209]|nr:hypothetical protein N0V90_001296 [Kalmusia sp. IMI 367209]